MFHVWCTHCPLLWMDEDVRLLRIPSTLSSSAHSRRQPPGCLAPSIHLQHRMFDPAPTALQVARLADQDLLIMHGAAHSSCGGTWHATRQPLPQQPGCAS